MKKVLIALLISFIFIPFVRADQEPIAIAGHRTIEKVGPWYFILCRPPLDVVCLIHDPVSGQVIFPDTGEKIYCDSISTQESPEGMRLTFKINK